MSHGKAKLLMRVCMASVSANYASCQWEPSTGGGQLYHPQCWHFWHSFIHNLLRVAMPAIMIMPPAINCASNDGNKNYNTRSIHTPSFLSVCLSLCHSLPIVASLFTCIRACPVCDSFRSFIHLFINNAESFLKFLAGNYGRAEQIRLFTRTSQFISSF